VVVEMSMGQLIDDVRLAVEGSTPVLFHGRAGGVVPTPGEVVDAARRARAATQPRTRTAIDPALEEPDPLSLIEDGAWAALRAARR
jgi:hypothetical protein